MRVKVIHEEGKTKVINVGNGRELHGIVKVEFVNSADSPALLLLYFSDFDVDIEEKANVYP